MAPWKPADNQVDSNEHIGRRLFDEPKLFGAADQDPFNGLSLHNFELGRDLAFSLDRVGNGSFNAQVRKYLTPRAEAAGRARRKPEAFHGWMILTARQLTTPHGWTIVPSPDRGRPLDDGTFAPWIDDRLDQNPYHAHIEVPPANKALFAFQARELFRKGRADTMARAAPEVAPSRYRWWSAFVRRIRRLIGHHREP